MQSKSVMKLFMKSYMGFSNRYYVPFMFQFALKRSLIKFSSSIKLEENSHHKNVSQLLEEIKKEKSRIIESDTTRNFLNREATERNMTDDSWLPLVAQYIASNRVLARELFDGDETRAMLFINDDALLPPVERMMSLVLGSKNKKGMMGGVLFNKPKGNESEDQYDVLENMWKLMNVANEFLQTWVLSHEIYNEESENGVRRVSSIKVHDCMLNRFFKEHQSTKLMPVICSFDSVWARNAFQNTGHKFRRDQTLSLDGKYCSFDFSKGFEKDEKDVVLEKLEDLRLSSKSEIQ